MSFPLLKLADRLDNPVYQMGPTTKVMGTFDNAPMIFMVNPERMTLTVNLKYLEFHASNPDCQFTKAYKDKENCKWDKVDGGVHEIKAGKIDDNLVLELASKLDLLVVLGTFGFIGDKDKVVSKVIQVMYPEA
jgi:hypothetical protein